MKQGPGIMASPEHLKSMKELDEALTYQTDRRIRMKKKKGESMKSMHKKMSKKMNSKKMGKKMGY